jgi:hypothetical protein
MKTTNQIIQEVKAEYPSGFELDELYKYKEHLIYTAIGEKNKCDNKIELWSVSYSKTWYVKIRLKKIDLIYCATFHNFDDAIKLFHKIIGQDIEYYEMVKKVYSKILKPIIAN